jgi:benzoylformate decarboxylase
MKIVDFLLDTLALCGVPRLFGNPGTTEIPLVRACEERASGPAYVVALSEVAAVPMADGHARATRGLGVVNLHVAPGLGNGMGNLYTAAVAGTPLLVLVGAQDSRLVHTDPILHGPVEQMAASVCKAVYRLTSAHDAATNIRRAIRHALTPPSGPVALICPPDVLDLPIDDVPVAVRAPALAALGEREAADYARALAGARRPAIIAGESVHWHDAAAELAALAAALDAPVYAAPYTGMLPVDASLPCYAGYLPPSFRAIEERLAGHDLLLYAGARGFRTTLFNGGRLPQRKAWIGDDAALPAENGEFELAHVAELKASLARVSAAIGGKGGGKGATAQRASLPLPAPDARALHPTRAIHALLERYREAALVDESGLSTSDVKQWLAASAGDYFINGSGGIGWGLAASVGIALARPEREVVAIVGDGSALYNSEALWSAAHHEARHTLVVLSNRRYATLNEGAARVVGRPELRLYSLEPPVIDFSGLARLYGYHYCAVDSEASLAQALAPSPGTPRTLIDVRIDPALKPVAAARHF